MAAQKVFFAHTGAGDLLPLFRGHYDTTTGPKREADSYRRIAADMELSTTAILFLSDVLQELDAAADAGMPTALVVRPGQVCRLRRSIDILLRPISGRLIFEPSKPRPIPHQRTTLKCGNNLFKS